MDQFLKDLLRNAKSSEFDLDSDLCYDAESNNHHKM